MVILSVQLLPRKCGLLAALASTPAGGVKSSKCGQRPQNLSENLPSTSMYHPTKSVQILPRKCGLPAALASTPGGSSKCGRSPRNLSENLPSTSMYHPTKFHIDPCSSLGGVRPHTHTHTHTHTQTHRHTD